LSPQGLAQTLSLVAGLLRACGVKKLGGGPRAEAVTRIVGVRFQRNPDLIDDAPRLSTIETRMRARSTGGWYPIFDAVVPHAGV
jgi:hypothetical protein